jgi:hypothetical protein
MMERLLSPGAVCLLVAVAAMTVSGKKYYSKLDVAVIVHI